MTPVILPTGKACVSNAHRQLRPERQELPEAPRQVARIDRAQRARITLRTVAEHQVLSGHWTMK